MQHENNESSYTGQERADGSYAFRYMNKLQERRGRKHYHANPDDAGGFRDQDHVSRGGGIITSDGGSAVTERGLCWGTAPIKG